MYFPLTKFKDEIDQHLMISTHGNDQVGAKNRPQIIKGIVDIQGAQNANVISEGHACFFFIQASLQILRVPTIMPLLL